MAWTAFRTFNLCNFTNPTTITSTQYTGRLDTRSSPATFVTFSVYWVPNSQTNLNGQARAANLYHSDRLNYSAPCSGTILSVLR